MTQLDPCRVGETGIFRFLTGMKIDNALRRQFERGFCFGRTGRHRRINLGLGDAQGFRAQRLAIIFFSQLNQSRIAARAHIVNNGGDGFIHIDRLLALHRLQSGETLGKILIVNMGA